jgi:hypothetical protein
MSVHPHPFKSIKYKSPKKTQNKNESKENGGFLYSTLRLIVS